MFLTADETKALGALQAAIGRLQWRSEQLDRVANREDWLAVGRAYREATLRQASLLQEALERDIPFAQGELDDIESIRQAIEDAAMKEDLVRNVLRLVGMLVPK
jgi:hypothetical protein